MRDALAIGLLVLYFGCFLSFSSFFYLATEDYEAVTAVERIAQGHLIGKSHRVALHSARGLFILLLFAQLRRERFRFSLVDRTTDCVVDNSDSFDSSHNGRNTHGFCIDVIVLFLEHLSASPDGVFH
jgi:hypothetical protein